MFDVIISEMDLRILCFDTSKNKKKTRKLHKTHKPFWNEELSYLWSSMHNKEKQFLYCNGRAFIKTQLRFEYLASQKAFDKKLR